jgi:predicted RNA-binding protein YlqC (UPF0109 family)
MEEKMFDQEFVEYIVKAIVDNSDDVTTERVVDEMGTLISLHVNAADMATIIGKEGRTAKALRTILRVLGAKHNERINLKIIEPEGGRGFMPKEDGDIAPTPASIPMNPRMSTSMGAPTMSSDDDAMADALRDVPQDEIA